MNSTPSSRPSQLLPFHPLAEMLPLMQGAEFDELVGDIERRGLHFPITVFEGQIIDGRNRARACVKASVEPRYTRFQGTEEEVARFIISTNIHRRHLKPDQRRDLIKQLLKMQPARSDRALAAELKVDKNTISAVRQQAEITGEISPVEKRIGTDGKARKRPAQSKPKPKLIPLKTKAAVAPPCQELVVPDAVAPDEALALLHEFAAFILNSARVTVDEKDLDHWKALNGRVRMILEGRH